MGLFLTHCGQNTSPVTCLLQWASRAVGAGSGATATRLAPPSFLPPPSKIRPIPCELWHALPGISPNKASFCPPLPRSGTHAVRGCQRGLSHSETERNQGKLDEVAPGGVRDSAWLQWTQVPRVCSPPSPRPPHRYWPEPSGPGRGRGRLKSPGASRLYRADGTS